MSLFNFRSHFHDDLTIVPGAKDGKIYRWVQLLAISVVVAALTLLILEIFQLLKIGSTGNGVICSIGVVGIGGLTALPWVRVFEGIKEKHFKITAIVFLGLTVVTVILWIVCVWRIIGIVNDILAEMSITEEAIEHAISSLSVIRVSLIVSLQFVIASSITMNVIKYRKDLLPYQIMSGISKLYIDFYLTLVMTAFTITREGLELSKTATILTNQWLFPLFIVFIMLTAFPSVVFSRADRKRLLAARKEGQNAAPVNAPQPPVPAPDPFGEISHSAADGDSVELKLEKIKYLLDHKLITQEEYDAKRAEILKNL